MAYEVPQGTVLESLLFNLCINDFFNLEINGVIVSFADDIVVLYHSNTRDDLKQTVENDYGGKFYGGMDESRQNVFLCLSRSR